MKRRRRDRRYPRAGTIDKNDETLKNSSQSLTAITQNERYQSPELGHSGNIASGPTYVG